MVDPEEEQLRRSVEADPQNAAARMALARALLARGQKLEAAEACENAAALFVSRGNAARAAGVYRRLAGIYKQLGRPAERLRVAKRMLELDPDDSHGEAHIAVADAYIEGGDPASALTILHEEVRMLEAVAMLEIIGNRASTQGGSAWKRVVAALDRIVRLDRKDVPSRITLARYQLQGKPAKALATLLEVLTLERNNIAGLKLIDHAFLAAGQFDRAARTYEEIVSVDPRAFDTRTIHRDEGTDLAGKMLIVEAAVHAGDMDTALGAVRKLDEVHPNRIPVKMKHFELLVAAGNRDLAMLNLSRAVSLAIEAGDTDYARGLLQAGFRVEPFHGGLREAAVRVTEHLKVFP